MKTLDVNNYGVQEMKAGEMREVEGGVVLLVAFLVLLAVGELLNVILEG